MTTLKEIRTTLLQQHADIRACIEVTRRAVSDAKLDDAVLRDSLSRLADVVRMHNAAEEEALQKVLPTIDAWGAVRKDVMVAEHVNEHSEIYGALVGAGRLSPGETKVNISELLDKMSSHMDLEEKTFLGADLLTEDAKVDGYGG